MNKINYQKQLDTLIDTLQQEEKVPTLLLHSCCAPCSSYVLEYLSQYFHITIFFFNPNIHPEKEYHQRAKEQQTLIHAMHPVYPITFVEGDYQPQTFFTAVKGQEQLGEGSERCFSCFHLRLAEAAKYAKSNNFDYFTTTLSISPMKNADKLNEIGGILSKEYQIPYLYSDFKKKNGYKRSIELSREYQLYRQDYCGCVFSKQERESQC